MSSTSRLLIFLLVNLAPPALLIVSMAGLMSRSSWLADVGWLLLFNLLAPLLVVGGNLLARMVLRRI